MYKSSIAENQLSTPNNSGYSLSHTSPSCLILSTLFDFPQKLPHADSAKSTGLILLFLCSLPPPLLGTHPQ